jgi:hypothetical protein
MDYETQGGEEDANSRTAMGEPRARCRQEELAPGEGRRRETHGNLERMGHAGATMMPALETSRLSLNLLKWLYSHCICSPKTGITLLNNQRGYVHSESPVFIRTVVVGGVDIAARRQRFLAASLLPRMMSANDGPGVEPTRRSAVPSPSPPNCDDVPVPCPSALRLPWPLQSLVVVIVPLSLFFSREPSPSSSSSSSSRQKERRSQIVKLVRGGQHTNADLRW